jgi:hypothetical protein
MLNIIGIGLYGVMSVMGKSQKTIKIPGRILITSGEMSVVNISGDDYLASQKELHGSFQNDGMMISYTGDAEFRLETIGG